MLRLVSYTILVIISLLTYAQGEWPEIRQPRRRPSTNDNKSFRKNNITSKNNEVNFDLTYVRKVARPVSNWRNLTKSEIERLKPSIDFQPIGTVPQSSYAGRTPVSVSNQITNGTAALKNQFPWQASVIQDNVYFCGGSVVTKTHILTAGHCCYMRKNFIILLGTVNYTNQLERIIFTSTTKLIHANFSSTTLNNDICVVQLTKPGISDTDITSGKIRPIRLPSKTQATNLFDGVNVTVSGWGKVNDSAGISTTLNFVYLTTISNVECAQIYGTKIVISSVMCTSGVNYKGICSGDSGGPMVLLEKDLIYTQIGIVSFGAYTSCSNSPSGYTRVSSFLGWLSQKCSVSIRN